MSSIKKIASLKLSPLKNLKLVENLKNTSKNPLQTYKKTSKIIFNDFLIKNNDVKMGENGLHFKPKNIFIPLTWNNVKKNGGTFLQKFSDFRKLYVDTLLEEVLNKLQCKPECYYIAAGSQNLDSDYDITIYSRFSSKIVDLFNDKFITLFKQRSDIVFDTNLYGTSFFHTSIATNYDYVIKDPGEKCNPDNFIYYINLNNLQDINNQHIWAFIKLIMQINKIHNTKIKNTLLKAIKDYPKTANILTLSEKKFKSLSKQNTSYLNELKKYDEIKRIFEAEPQRNEKLTLSLKDQISKTNFYGAETYFTQGAVNHVVGELQLNFKRLRLSKHEYLDSMIENLGDMIKEYAHYPDDHIEFTTHASKYIIRIGYAIKELKKGDSVSKKLINIGLQLRKYRGTNKFELIRKQNERFRKLYGFKNQSNIHLVIYIIQYCFNIIEKHYMNEKH